MKRRQFIAGRHKSDVINAIIRLILPLLEPTRWDQTLKKFPNYFDLWGPVSRAQ
jgi:hypothetical protein